MRGGLMVMTMLLAGAASAAAVSNEAKRVEDAARVVREITSAPDKSIPENIWQKAQCVVVIPDVKKAAFVVGGEYGKGVASCRQANRWTAPAFLKLEKGSFGAQIGAEATDLVLLVMNEQGIDRLLQDKVTLGADASLAAGPVGRSGAAATDAQLTAEMLSYSRARGLFAGVDLSGGVLRPDDPAGKAFYGQAITARDILLAKWPVTVPSPARPLIAALKAAPHGTAAKHGA